MTAATRTFFWPNLEFLNVHVRRVGDAVTGDRRESTPRQCQPPPSTRTTRVHPLSLNLPCLPKPTFPIAVRRILQEAKELANDESTDYTAAPLEVCHISSPLPRQTFTHLIPGRHICESYPPLALSSRIFIPKSKEWHCTIRGPAGTEFEGGLYHFRILLPSEYPFRPPSILMLTPNGRFELNTKARSLIPQSLQPVHLPLTQICISFTNCTFCSTRPAKKSFHLSIRLPIDHEESWQPAWGVRTGIPPSSIIHHMALNCIHATAILGLQGFFPLRGKAALGVGGMDSPISDRKRLAALYVPWSTFL